MQREELLKYGNGLPHPIRNQIYARQVQKAKNTIGEDGVLKIFTAEFVLIVEIRIVTALTARLAPAIVIVIAVGIVIAVRIVIAQVI